VDYDKAAGGHVLNAILAKRLFCSIDQLMSVLKCFSDLKSIIHCLFWMLGVSLLNKLGFQISRALPRQILMENHDSLYDYARTWIQKCFQSFMHVIRDHTRDEQNMYGTNEKSCSVDSTLRSLTAQNHHKVNMVTPRWFKLKSKHLLFEPGSVKREPLAILGYFGTCTAFQPRFSLRSNKHNFFGWIVSLHMQC